MLNCRLKGDPVSLNTTIFSVRVGVKVSFVISFKVKLIVGLRLG